MAEGTVAFVLLDQGEEHHIEVDADGDEFWLRAEDVLDTVGWELKPEGLCQGDYCIPLGVEAVRKGRIGLGALAALLERPLALSQEHGVAYLGPPPNRFTDTVGNLEAPDFELPDLEGRTHTLSEHRGSKVLLAAWASW